MKLTELEDFLHQINIFEKKQRETGIAINDFSNSSVFDSLQTDPSYIDPGFNIVRFPKSMFFSECSNIFISRHNRFAPMVEHLHDFIEINYVYSGTCTQIINGEKVFLSQGSLCVLDRNVPHSIKALGQDDILINILINEETFSSLFLFKLQNTSNLLGKFLADAFNQESQHNQYIVFDTKQNPIFHNQIQLMLCEYWSKMPQGSEFLSHYLQLILMELMRIYSEETYRAARTSNFDYAKILIYIDQNYANLALSTLAKEFGYNPNYLSNMLKKYIGKNFQQILLEKRLLIACDLLTNTNLSMEDVASESGFKSSSYFFRQFKKHYCCTPNSYRKKY
ncbi:AraC family transcriptional regulator [uncultured Streptococcus sp.]|uniref:AraC family transcriptional regulator n=1 Tax=uncultured Streptococcus sp. TaxID=83427 RepID=UPI0026123B5E|nr:AraC family transcriptional regulator [uncultured Streptococcus sp.]